MAGGPKLSISGQKPDRDRHLLGATNAMLLVMPLYLLQIYDRVLPAYSLSTLTYITLIALGRAGRAGHARSRPLLLCRPRRQRASIPRWLRRLHDLDERTARRARRRAAVARPGRRSAASSARAALFFLFDLPFSPLFIPLLYLVHPVLFYVTIVRRRRDGGRRGRQPDGYRQAGPAGGRVHDDVDEHGAVVRPQFRDGARARHDRQHHRGVGQEVRGIDQSVGRRRRAATRSMADCRAPCAWCCRTASCAPAPIWCCRTR